MYDALKPRAPALAGAAVLLPKIFSPTSAQISFEVNKANTLPDVGQELLKSWVILQMARNSLSDHSVLAHEDDSCATGRNLDLLHLLESDIADVANECPGVLLEKLGELDEVVSLPGGFIFLDHIRAIVARMEF